MTEYLRTQAAARTASTFGRWSTAAQQWTRVVERNPVNGNHWHQLASAHFSLGDFAAALPAYERARELGVWRSRDLAGPSDLVFPADIEYKIACCHAQLDQLEQATAALSRAMDLGLRDHEQAWTDPMLAALRSDSWFAATFEPVDVDGLSRDEGWRHDLRLFAREVRRRAYRSPVPDFDKEVAQLEETIPQLSDSQLVIALTRLLRPFGDGHAFVDPPDPHPLRAALPLRFYLFEEGLHVIAAARQHRRLVGAHVLAFDGRPVPDVLAAVDTVMTRDNEQGPKHAAATWLRRQPFLHALGVVDDPSAVTLDIETPEGERDEVRVAADSVHSALVNESVPPPDWVFYPSTLATPQPLYLRNPGVLYWFEHLPRRRLVYFQWNGVGNDEAEDFDTFSRRLFDFVHGEGVEKLVIDLRFNSGGNTVLSQLLLHRVLACPVINRPGGLFVIIGRKTFSAAQNAAVFLERHTHAVFAGEPTGSSPNFVGETTPFVLPYSKLEVNVSDLFWQSSWPMDHRTWIAPELYAPPTFAAYSANADPALDAILACDQHLPGW